MTDFAASFGVGLFDGRLQLKAALSAYAVHRPSGPLEARFAASTWNQSVSILSGFNRWAVDEGYATAEPFTYRQATTFFSGVPQQVRVNLARRRQPKEHVTVKYLADDFAELFLLGLAGLDRTGGPLFKGRELARNVSSDPEATGKRQRRGTRYEQASLLAPG